MKKLLLLTRLFFVIQVSGVLAQGTNCSNADPFCTGTTYVFPNNTGVPDGGTYNCLTTSPNPAWYYLQIATSGNIDIGISQTSTAGVGIDVDFICWGPFSSLAAGCSTDLSSNSGVDCSYSPSPTETCNIPSAVAGQYYILLLTNFSNTAGTITFSQTGGTGSTNCSIVCATPNATAGAPQTITCTTTSVGLTASSTTPGVTYSWTGPGGYTSTAQNPTGITTAGTYTVTVTDPANPTCPGTATQTVALNNTPPNLTTGPTLNITCASPSVNLTGSSTTSGVTYSWAGPGGFTSSSASPTGITTFGTYTLTVTNPANGCVSTGSQTVNLNNTPPDASAGSTLTMSCASSFVNLSGNSTTGGVTYSWAGPSGFSSSVQNPSVSSAGTYTLTVTNPANGCTATATQTVNPSAGAPNATAGAPVDLTCTTTSVDLSGNSTTPGVSYSWTGPAGYSSSAASPTGITTAGTYTLTVTDPGSGCTTVVTQTVNSNTTAPNAAAGAPVDITCAVSSVSLSGNSLTSGVSYDWSGPAGYTSSTQNPTGITTAGTYTVTVTDPANGCTATATQVVNTNTTPPDATAGPAQTLTCTSAFVNLSGSSSTFGATFSWTGPGSFTSTAAGPSVTLAGTYTLTVTDPANGCTATTTQDVNPSAGAPDISTGGTVNITCANSSVSLSGASTTSGVTYSWTGPSGFTSTSATPSGVATPGTYTLTITDPANGCTSTSTQTVGTNTTAPIASGGPDQSISCSGTSATLNGTGSSSGVNFVYTWTTADGTVISGGSTATPNVSGGNYTLTVTDTSNGCSSTDVVGVTQAVSPTASFSATPTSGMIPLDVAFTNSSVNADSYSWNFGNGSTAAGASPSDVTYDQYGNYVVTLIVTNSTSGCSDTMTVNIFADANSIITVPNIFTPNGDGHNELFSVTSFAITTFKAQIFDRWGLKMSEWTDVNGGWDGKAKNGSPAPDGTYYYIIDAKGFDGKEYNFKGYLSLVR